MSQPERDRRRPLPALIFILALTVLAGIVWLRVLHRANGDAAHPPSSTSSCPSPTPTRTTKSTVSTPIRVTEPPRTVPPIHTVRVRVLNATDRTGLAGRTTDELHHDGFRTATPANDHSGYHGAGVGEVRYPPGAQRAAQLLTYFVPGAKLIEVRGGPTSGRATITLSLGQKFTGLRSRKHAVRALRRDHVTVSRNAIAQLPTPAPTPTPTLAPTPTAVSTC